MRILTPDASEFEVDEAPFYQPVGAEVEGFERAFKSAIPVVLKGPTGCGKTRFVSYMAHKLGRPLVTVACHEDLTASDLVGRYVLEGDETVWVDGPLTAAVRLGAILYLDEVVEARKDTMVVIHPLADHRRSLLIDKLGSVVNAADGFMLVMSYNPGYQSILKDLKPSTRQRFVFFDFGYPPAAIEQQVVLAESGVDAYAGFVYEENCIQRSPFHELNDLDPSRALAVKVDGATKELCFFGGRVGFVTFGANGDAAAALESKIKGLTRANVSSVPAVSQAIVLSALQDPSLASQQGDLLRVCTARFNTLKRCISASNLPTVPFNSGFFALISVSGDPHTIRKRLLKRGIGVVAMPQYEAIRIAFSSTSESDIPALITAIAEELNP